MISLANLPKLKGKHKSAKRVGRGVGSGKGSHTAGRGQKGQKARSGFNLPVGFEGGQVPIFKKMPKLKGFVNSHRTRKVALNITILNAFEDGAVVNPQALLKKKLIQRIPNGGVKILGNGELTKKVTLEGFSYSASAKEKIEKAGGKAQ